MTEQPKCRLCGSISTKLKFHFDSCDVVECCNCRFAQTDISPEKKDLLRYYDAAYFDRGKYVDDASGAYEQRRRIKWLSRNDVKPGARILDAGCATGDFISAAKYIFEVWGVDISEHAINSAVEKFPELSARLAASPLEEYSCEPHFFDAITLWDVIEHLSNPLETVKIFSGFLKPGGIMAVSTPDIGSVAARFMGKRWAFMTPPEHLSFFNLRTIGELAEKSGGKLISHAAGGKWTNLGFLFYKANRVFPKAVSGVVARTIQNSPFSRLPVYIPTHDILYAGIRY